MRAFFDWLEANWAGIFEGDAAARLHAIEQSCLAKAAIVAEDETRHRAAARCSISATHSAMRWRPGRAIPPSCCTARRSPSAWCWPSRCRRRWGFARAGAADRVAAHLPSRRAAGAHQRYRRENRAAPCRVLQELVELMAQDKKAAAGRLTFVLVRGIGDAFVSDAVEPDRLLAFLQARCTA